MRATAIVLLAGLLLAPISAVRAQSGEPLTAPVTPLPPAVTPTAPPANPGDATSRFVTREMPLGTADLVAVEQMLKETLSPGGSWVFMKIKRTVKITDTPEKIETVRPILDVLSRQSAINVRIDVMTQSMGNANRSGASVSGVYRSGGVGVVVPPPPGTRPGGNVRVGGSKGAIDINLLDQKTGSSSLSNQFILVGNGRAGVIEVVREIPMVDFFMLYTPRTGFLLPETRWEKAGSQLLVKPIVSGDLITVEVTPRVSNVTFANRGAFDRRPVNRALTGVDQFITYTELTTTVTVQNGGSIQIGGFASAPSEFNRYFFGGSSTAGQTVGTITLKATVQ